MCRSFFFAGKCQGGRKGCRYQHHDNNERSLYQVLKLGLRPAEEAVLQVTTDESADYPVGAMDRLFCVELPVPKEAEEEEGTLVSDLVAKTLTRKELKLSDIVYVVMGGTLSWGEMCSSSIGTAMACSSKQTEILFLPSLESKR